MNTDVERYLTVSAKIDTSDIEWSEAAKVGLTPDEVFALTYFSDIESQTIRYLHVLLGMKIAYQPAIAAFLSTWSYEEFFHGHALSRLLTECGHALEENRVQVVRKRAGFNEWLEKALGPLFSHLFSAQFPALYMAFGAVQELTTLRGYERLGETTANPILRTLCHRIAKQERRHFAWYFNSAREQLANSRSAQYLTRKLLQLVWVPVGAGVKSRHDVVRLFSILFPGRFGREMICEVDTRIGILPGLKGIRLMQVYFGRAVDERNHEAEGAYELGSGPSLNRITLGIFAPVLIVVGILGFVLPSHLSLTSGAAPYNVFHLVFGAIGIGLVMLKKEGWIRAFCIGFGAIDLYQALASYFHLFPERYFAWTRVDDVLHVVVGLALVVIGIAPGLKAQRLAS